MENKMQKRISNKVPFYYGWIVLVVAGLSVFFSAPGQTFFISVFIDRYIEEFGWLRSTVSSFYSAATLVSGLLLFIVGKVVDRHGHKKMMMLAAFLLGITCIWNSFLSGLGMLFIGFFFGRNLGQGTMTLIPSTIIPHWFVKKRAFAFSLMAIGGVVGSALIPPLNTFLISSMGWRNTWRLWAGILWVIFIPLVYFFLSNKPEDLGLMPDNKLMKNTSKEEVEKEKKENDKASWTLKEAMKTKTYWFMLIVQIIMPLISTGITFHFISIMKESGLEPKASAFVLSLIAIVAFPSTFLAGLIMDKMKIKTGALILSLLVSVAMVILFFSNNTTLAILFAIVQGSALGMNAVLGGIIWPEYFGIKHLGSIRGSVMTATVIGAALGPMPFGIMYDVFGGYQEAILIVMVFPIAGIIASLLSEKPVKKY